MCILKHIVNYLQAALTFAAVVILCALLPETSLYAEGGDENRARQTSRTAKNVESVEIPQPDVSDSLVVRYVLPPRSISDVVARIEPERPTPGECASEQFLADGRRRGAKFGGLPGLIRYLETQVLNHYMRGNLTEGLALVGGWIDDHSSSYRETGVAYALLAKYAALSGDFNTADEALRGLGRGLSGQTYNRVPLWCLKLQWTDNYECLLQQRRSEDVLGWVKVHEAVARGTVAQSKGLYEEAEAHFREAYHLQRLHYRGMPAYDHPVLWSLLAENLMRQGRLVEAEIESRNAVLKDTGEEAQQATNLLILADILYAAGRYPEATLLGRLAGELYESSCLQPGPIRLALAKQLVARALVGQAHWNDAIGQFEAIRAALMPVDPELFQRKFAGDTEWGLALLETGRVNEAVKPIQLAHARSRARLGVGHPQTAKALAFLAVAHAAQGNRQQALQEFRRAIPILLEAWKQRTDERSFATTRSQQLRFVLEAYLELLNQIRGTRLEGELGTNAVGEMYRIADVARGSAVQEALVANSVRAAADDPALAELVRRQQDARSQIGAVQNLLLSVMSQPPADQNPAVISDLRSRIEKLRKLHATLLTDIEQRFPRYAELVSPEPPTLERTRAVLKPGEALISILVSDEQTYVWAIPKSGEVAYSVRELGRGEVERLVTQLRAALEPDAQTLGDIPRFELEVAHRLYEELLEPVSAGWAQAKTLLVVADGALGQLPLSLLPTESVSTSEKRSALFSEYRDVPWVARQYAVVSLPSAASLVALRGATRQVHHREAFLGFGDPWFSAEQAAAGETQLTTRVAALDTRGLTLRRRFAPRTREVDSAELGKLPRLPETADEVREMALALGADVSRDVFIGQRASEAIVKGADLSGRRVLAFATHGLVPGDLNGLTQPALALSSPTVTGEQEDGLLTMGEVLGLKLDADWVVLSACNTASADGAGAEAVSGLGRAFFYAGARSLLVTHWPVETTSAKALTTEVFSQQSQDRTLTRGEALRRAMIKLIDGPGYVDRATGQSLFSYAHPLFWAPFALVGDGAN